MPEDSADILKASPHVADPKEVARAGLHLSTDEDVRSVVSGWLGSLHSEVDLNPCNSKCAVIANILKPKNI